MKNLQAIIICILLPLYGFSQDSTDYFVNLDGEKVFCTIQGHSYKKLKVTVDGETVRYNPTEVKGFKDGDMYYECGKVPYGSYGAKTWCFMEVIERGEMSLYVVSSSTLVEDGVTGQQSSVTAVVYFVKLKKTALDDYTKIGMKWKKDLSALGSGCSAFLAAVKKSSYGDWNCGECLSKVIQVYNEECAEE